jgi:hypothetical protein
MDSKKEPLIQDSDPGISKPSLKHIENEASLKIKDLHGHLVDFKDNSSPIESTTNRDIPMK